MARFCGACGGHFAMTIEGIAALSAVAGMAKGIQVGAALVAQHPRACMCMCVCVFWHGAVLVAQCLCAFVFPSIGRLCASSG